MENFFQFLQGLFINANFFLFSLSIFSPFFFTIILFLYPQKKCFQRGHLFQRKYRCSIWRTKKSRLKNGKHVSFFSLKDGNNFEVLNPYSNFPFFFPPKFWRIFSQLNKHIISSFTRLRSIFKMISVLTTNLKEKFKHMILESHKMII